MGRLPRPTGKELLRFLERQGFSLVRITGSHHHMQKERLRIAIPVHGNTQIKIGTLSDILRKMKMSHAEFERLWRG